ncbi:MAG: EF-P lysine aminoacylase GenX [Planctomycetaceae bacterium]|jgi:lysyl-tRNA synthetase class 2|nr:EF-P lysine aminoacylase GenX [Planctomycetaceae bacterium]
MKNSSCETFLPILSLQRLKERAAVMRRIRDYFESRGFLEVETPILSRDTVVDRYLEPFEVFDDGAGCLYYLQTSPEFAMKRLLAAGATALFQTAHVFRKGDCGQTHNPEFTMLEWYRAGENYETGVAFLSDFINAILQRGRAKVVTLRELFDEYLRLNPHTVSCRELREIAQNKQISFPDSFRTEEESRGDWVDLIFSEIIQPRLGLCEPTIITDYLASQSQLAKTRTVFGDAKTNGSFQVSERFELFVDGLELANGYHELLDADVLSDRIRKTNALRAADGKKMLPEESQLLEAMRRGLPACSGCALGIDRLLMVFFGVKNIADVMPFDWNTA